MARRLVEMDLKRGPKSPVILLFRRSFLRLCNSQADGTLVRRRHLIVPPPSFLARTVRVRAVARHRIDGGPHPVNLPLDLLLRYQQFFLFALQHT